MAGPGQCVLTTSKTQPSDSDCQLGRTAATFLMDDVYWSEDLTERTTLLLKRQSGT